MQKLPCCEGCEISSFQWGKVPCEYSNPCRRAYESREAEVERLKVPDAVENAAEHLFRSYAAWDLGGLGTAVSDFWRAWDEWRGVGKEREDG